MMKMMAFGIFLPVFGNTVAGGAVIKTKELWCPTCINAGFKKLSDLAVFSCRNSTIIILSCF